MPDPVNLNPADMGDLTTLMPITFSYQGAPATAFVFVWVKYEDSDREILVYDGVEFLVPFAANSEVFRPREDDTLINFKIVPELGWLGPIAKLRTEAFFGTAEPQSELWAVPSSPGFIDIEFNNGNQLDNGWLGFGDLDFNNPPSLFGGGFNDADKVKISIDTRRRSTMVIQSSFDMPSTGPIGGTREHGGIYYRHTGELPDGTYWMRGGATFHYAGPISDQQDDGTFGFALLAWRDDISYPSHFDGPHIYLNEPDSPGGDMENEAHMHNNDDSPSTASDVSSLDWGNAGTPHEYKAIIKRGNFYESWFANEAGAWIQFGNAEYTGVEQIETISVEIYNQTAGTPSNFQGYVDFIRYLPFDESGSAQLP